MADSKLIPLADYRQLPDKEMKARAKSFYNEMRKRRSVRSFSEKPIPREVIEDCLLAAGTSPSGANMQPWYFVVAEEPAVKREIREAAEQAEREFYSRSATEEFLDALAPLGTDASKPFLEMAPCLIAVFVQRYGLTEEGDKVRHYYPTESVGIATGLLIAAIHHAGLVALPYTPSPMGFLNEILKRGDNERAMLILVVGYPGDGTMVPDICKKGLDEIATFI
ncbi:MAG: nitroreductase family protein [Planctomycetota bacterium]|jgi:nitroreductase